MKTNKLQHDIVITILKAIVILFTVSAFGFCWTLYYSKQTQVHYYWRGTLLIIAIYLVLYLVFARVYDAMQISVVRIGQLAFSQALAIGLSDVMIYI